MAEINTVPLGQAGTGAAFVLGRNTALDRYLQNRDYNAQIAQQEALLAQKQRQQQQQKLNDDYIKNALDVKAGLVFPDINERAKGVMEKGREIFQRGINPWQPYTGNDPKIKAEVDELQRNRLMVEEESQKRDLIQPLLLKEMTSYDPNKFTKESFDRLNEYSKLPAAEAFKTTMPTLQPKLNPNEVLAKVKIEPEKVKRTVGTKTIEYAGADPDKTKRSIVNQLRNEPSTNAFLKEDLGIPNLTIDDLERLPKTLEGIKGSILKEYDGSKSYREAIAKEYGITNKDQFEKQIVDPNAQKAFQAKSKWDRFIGEATKQKLAEVGFTDVITRDLSEERLRAKQASDSAKDKDPTYRQDLLNRALDNEGDAFIEIGEAIKDKYRQLGATTIAGENSSVFTRKQNPNTGDITITLAPVYGKDKEGERRIIKESKTFTYNPKDRERSAQILNSLMNEYTPEKVQASAVLTPQGKKKVPGGQTERDLDRERKPTLTIKASDVAAKARAAGYTASEYRKLLISKGVKIQ